MANQMGGVLLERRTKEKKEVQRQYNVILHNDDYTPAMYVVMVLGSVFEKDQHSAISLMTQAHTGGCAVVGTYDKKEAYSKVEEANKMNEQSGNYLVFSIEED